MNYYKQCTLKKKDRWQTAWIPTEFAIRGKVLKIKSDDGWVVETVGLHRQAEDYLLKHERDYLHQRKASDI